MGVIKITSDNFNNEVLKSDKPVLVDFWAAWCGPCKMLSPVVEQLSNEMPDVKFASVNVDEEPALASQFGVVSIPMLVVIKDGKIVDKSVGYRPKDALRAMITK